MRRAAAGACAVALALAGCGGGGDGDAKPKQTAQPAGVAKTKTTTRVEVVEGIGSDGAFDPRTIYRKEAPGVVTVISIFGGGGLDAVLGGGEDGGIGSGFVLNGAGEILTNAHVVTTKAGNGLEPAGEVYVAFADGNRVPAKVRGFDPNADVALLKIDPEGLDLHPLPLGTSADVQVGSPVAAMGSPFGEEQSLSVGVVSAVDRDVESLTDFRISGAIQTDAAINPGNSGGPLVDAQGRVIGLNQQIQSQSGGNEGVGFAVPIDLARRSVAQLRRSGRADYAYIGLTTQEVYPQLAAHFHLPVERGAWVQEVSRDGPADAAGLRGGGPVEQPFQATSFRKGGDIIVEVAGRKVEGANDLAAALVDKSPGQTVDVVVYRGNGEQETVRVKLGRRPAKVTGLGGG